jgi:hypothetical protein
MAGLVFMYIDNSVYICIHLRQQPFSYVGMGWDFHCARKNFFQNLPQSTYFFLIMWNRNTFFHENNTLTYIHFISRKTYLKWMAPPLLIEMLVPSQESQRSCMCGVPILLLCFYEFSIGLWNRSFSVVFFAFRYI